jgi:hypothetical protein
MKVDRNRYKELSAGKPVPYCFEIKRGRQTLFYFGANHSHDPKDKQYPILRRYWKKFLDTRSTKKAAVIEGYPRKIRKNDREAIMSGSEGSLVTLWAHNKGMPIINPEPPLEDSLAKLIRRFPKDAVRYYHFAGLVDNWLRYNPRPNFLKWMDDVMKFYQKEYGWENYTLMRMKEVHRKLFGKRFTLRNPHAFNLLVNPNRTDTIINRIAQASSDIRDEAILRRIIKEWRAGRSLFVAYGSGHAFLHEPILKKYLE